MNKIIGLVNFHSSPEVAPLTDNRPLGSTSFLARFGLCDFALSNLCNSGIATIGLLVKDHQRSILKHIGSMDSWLSNTKTGQEIVMYNEGAHLHPESNTDINNIRENDWVLYDSSIDYIVIVPAHIVMNIDLRPFIKEHIEHEENITVVTAKIRNLSTQFLNAPVLEVDEEGYAIDMKQNSGLEKKAGLCSLGVYIINRTCLASMIHEVLPMNPYMPFLDLVMSAVKANKYRLKTVVYDGFYRCIDTFPHYVEYSLGMLEKKNADALFRKDWPIYTLTHDTPPTLYGPQANINNSYIANGAVIEGTVINSIIARNVVIGKGAVVKNSIIFSSSHIGEEARVENAVIDKYAIITRGHTVSGSKASPFYAHQGAML